MRNLILSLVLISAVSLGCVGRKNIAPAPKETTGAYGKPPGPIITPERGLAGKVLRVNTQGRFVVLNFPIGQLPTLEQRLNVYRRGLKTGEVKVTGPQRDDNIVADIVAGDAEPGDEVRDR